MIQSRPMGISAETFAQLLGKRCVVCVGIATMVGCKPIDAGGSLCLRSKVTWQKVEPKMWRDGALTVLFKHPDLPMPKVDGLFSCVSQYIPYFGQANLIGSWVTCK